MTGIALAHEPQVLKSAKFQHYVDSFNANDQELYPGYITNGSSWNFLRPNIPLFECPDKSIEETYYFRWWTYAKHIKRSPDGFIITEFLPDVPWAGKDDSIVCAAGHHFYEGRWLADSNSLDDYAVFWFRQGGDPRLYSTWLADALWARYLVNGNARFVTNLLPDLVRNYVAWEKSHLDASGLFRQIDDRDGMEMSAGGSGYRPTINSYMYGDATAIANIARLAGQPAIAREFQQKAAKLKSLILRDLWNRDAKFFETRHEDQGRPGGFANVREEIGFTPWYFNLPNGRASIAWKQLVDAEGFQAPFGPTTCEQRSPEFKISYNGHECQWNGPSWPYATSITLTALANLLNDYHQKVITRHDYLNLLKVYTQSQHLKMADGRVVPWIDEDLDPTTGTWLARTLLQQRGATIPERGKDYNHSTYCDLIITGLAGLRPRADNIIEINPLIPPDEWPYFCLDNVHYHGHILTILYDKTGQQYGQGKGLRIFVDGKEIAAVKHLQRLTGIMECPPLPR